MISASQRLNGQRKDTVTNIEETGELVWNMATYDLREAVCISGEGFPPDTDEFVETGLTKADSLLVKPPRVSESPVHFECKHLQTIRLASEGDMGATNIILARVVMIHIDDDALTPDGRIDIPGIKPLARLGYYDYTCVEQTFEMLPRGRDPALLKRMAGDRSV